MTTDDYFDHTEQVIADIQAAKEYLLEHGWCQGTERSMDPKVEETCVVGALNAVLFGWPNHTLVTRMGPELREKMSDRRLRAYGALLGDLPDGVTVARWNDEEGRGFNEVIEALDTTIIRLKETHGD